MAPIYAGILGPLAFLTSLARGVVHGGGSDSVVLAAWCHLIAFAAVGYVIGRVADRTVEESVRARISAQLAAQAPAEASRPVPSEAPGT